MGLHEGPPLSGFTDVVPHMLIGAIEGQFDDDPTMFMHLVRPHLIEAYFNWYKAVDEVITDPDSRREFHSAHAYMSVGLVGQLTEIYDYTFQRERIMRVLGMPSLAVDPGQVDYSPEGLAELYPSLRTISPNTFWAEVYGSKSVRPNSEDGVGTVYDFLSLLVFKHWEDFYRKTGIPFAMEFEHPLTMFPYAINLGEIVLTRTFDKFVLPTFIRNDPYRSRFYDYYARKYEKEMDQRVKSGVFSGLFARLPARNMTVIDIGCGSGLIMNNLPSDMDVHVIGLDENASMVKMALEKGEHAVVGKARDCVSIFGTDSFECALASFWDYWEPDDQKTASFSAIRRVLKPGGRLVFNVHKPSLDWEEGIRKRLVDECGFATVHFSQELIERTNGGVYTAYYVSAEV